MTLLNTYGVPVFFNFGGLILKKGKWILVRMADGAVATVFDQGKAIVIRSHNVADIMWEYANLRDANHKVGHPKVGHPKVGKCAAIHICYKDFPQQSNLLSLPGIRQMAEPIEGLLFLEWLPVGHKCWFAGNNLYKDSEFRRAKAYLKKQTNNLK